MQSKRCSVRLRATLLILTVILWVTSSYAATEKILHSFGNGSDGSYPTSALVVDASGNLYGTTFAGGTYGLGTVFELSPKAGGGWTEKILHSFGKGTDGANLYAGLVFDDSGNLYGTTYAGGTYAAGTAFELSLRTGGGWAEKILHNFGNGTDGANPCASLIFDIAGSLYGTTYQGGAYTVGTVFEMSPKAGGGWTEKTLHSFGKGTDGANPFDGLIFDASGNLYGTTLMGGAYTYYGVAFELMRKVGGGWTEKILHNFGNTGDGSNPSGLIFDGSGNLYGTTSSGGAGYLGTVFQLTPSSGGDWTETLLFSFDFTDGSDPHAGLIFDAAGNLYGVTDEGGASESGTAFELTPGTGGNWTETILHSFALDGRDGANPYANLVSDAAGNLYSTTNDGGTYGLGAVFEITP
ncbi:MAG: choice-of-anchor tandem repeat GloVer-containing protein [Candidatus Sulfotelmatobacter sp.]